MHVGGRDRHGASPVPPYLTHPAGLSLQKSRKKYECSGGRGAFYVLDLDPQPASGPGPEYPATLADRMSHTLKGNRRGETEVNRDM